MMRQRPKYVLQKLPDEDDALAAAHRFDQLLGGFAAQLGFHNVVKVLFAQQIQAVAADTAQQTV